MRPGEREKRGDYFWAFYQHQWWGCGTRGFPLEVVGVAVEGAPYVIRRTSKDSPPPVRNR